MRLQFGFRIPGSTRFPNRLPDKPARLTQEQQSSASDALLGDLKSSRLPSQVLPRLIALFRAPSSNEGSPDQPAAPAKSRWERYSWPWQPPAAIRSCSDCISLTTGKPSNMSPHNKRWRCCGGVYCDQRNALIPNRHYCQWPQQDSLPWPLCIDCLPRGWRVV